MQQRTSSSNRRRLRKVGTAISAAIVLLGLGVDATPVAASTITAGKCQSTAYWNGPWTARGDLVTGNCDWTQARAGAWQSPGWAYAYGPQAYSSAATIFAAMSCAARTRSSQGVQTTYLNC